jgi:MFS superfamily sulfate permease-like transporter
MNHIWKLLSSCSLDSPDLKINFSISIITLLFFKVVAASWQDYILFRVSLAMRCGWKEYCPHPSPLISISAFQIFSAIYPWQICLPCAIIGESILVFTACSSNIRQTVTLSIKHISSSLLILKTQHLFEAGKLFVKVSSPRSDEIPSYLFYLGSISLLN